jgi:hypothetical protein
MGYTFIRTHVNTDQSAVSLSFDLFTFFFVSIQVLILMQNLYRIFRCFLTEISLQVPSKIIHERKFCMILTFLMKYQMTKLNYMKF